ncbi:MAG: C26 family cysteine hydrolase domain-containing family, partial [Clostridiales bacterium]|nr:C26 family cysteine hydrolase domain-containing family [Clostridiales bacterium]
MLTPLIALTAGKKEQEIYLDQTYSKSIVAAGGIPIIVPLTLGEKELGQIAKICHGFLFTGGGDIEPCHYGEETLTYCGEICPQRDQMF